jgi:glyceraldehyde 3-phosphate dehydrogenase
MASAASAAASSAAWRTCPGRVRSRPHQRPHRRRDARAPAQARLGARPVPRHRQVEDGALIINGDKVEVTAEKDPAEDPVEGARRRHRPRVHRQVRRQGGLRQAPRRRRQEGADQRAGQGPRRHACAAASTKRTYEPAEHHIISNASCTTNCLAPVAKVLTRASASSRHDDDDPQLHQRSADPRPAAQGSAPGARGCAVDDPDHHRRRQGAQGGAAGAGKGKLDGMAMRVPTPNVSLVDLTVRLRRRPRDRGQRGVPRRGGRARSRASCGVRRAAGVVRLQRRTALVDGRRAAHHLDRRHQVKVLAWYDNEMGYSQRLLDLAKFVGERL